MTLPQFVAELLSCLERREARLLSWGFYNVQWSSVDLANGLTTDFPSDVRHEWQDISTRLGMHVPDLLLLLVSRQIVYPVPGVTDSYRTRFAEGVRLAANLRQIFRAQDWATAPRLVSDVKIHLARREYPKRDVSRDQVWSILAPLCSGPKGNVQRDCFYALATGKNGQPLDFAGFQARAFEFHLKRYRGEGLTGSMVCAGTGSGKTKAFYVPAFLSMVPELGVTPFTKVIAVYPRNVLLADQLREAISEARKISPVLKQHGLRPLRFGALLGTTPLQAWLNQSPPPKWGWKEQNGGHVIPHLKSPIDGRSDLIWRAQDRLAGRTALYRPNELQPDVEDGTLIITREELMQNPPDVLFLSIEMLNREMGNTDWERTFGIRRGADSPRLLLLDEVHSYQGVTGAQVAWVLRRWRYWAKIRALHVTGLSATLRDPAQHLARVIGVAPNLVEEFRPRSFSSPSEMEQEGMEYSVAVKGDPASGASLLATSIQSGMLFSRLLTPARAPQTANPQPDQLYPELFFRRKVFGFSDNLDSVNRWFNDMADAERRQLAAHRRTGLGADPVAEAGRRAEGQVWDLPERIGHVLTTSLNVARCSSRDPGNDPNADLVIATSSLEVGYDDPDVGIVLHHKNPKSMASFIQRRGRAGRVRGSRPITVVVLSDYGADRWAFQNAEKLFSPEIDSISLPIYNPYVLRVQATFFLLDWLARRTHQALGSFSFLSGPEKWHKSQLAQDSARNDLRRLLEQGTTWNDFRRELGQFFERNGGLDQAGTAVLLDDVLWQEPRPLLLQAVPTLLRKLERNWQRASGGAEDISVKHPLPQFIPKTTFDEIDSGGATLHLEPFNHTEREPETMSIGQMLFESCPGRVSKRFADMQNEPGYWHEVSNSLQVGSNVLEIGDLYPQAQFIEAVGGVQVFQPDIARVVHRPKNAGDSSNASWQWKVSIRPEGQGLPLPVRIGQIWESVFSHAETLLHSGSEWMEILRYAERAEFELSRNRARDLGHVELSHTSDSGIDPAAVGFKLRVDAIRFRLSPAHLASLPQISSADLERFRTDFFIHSVKNSPVLRGQINVFRADWLAQTSLAMLTATALLNRVSLQTAQTRILNQRPQAARRVLEIIFRFSGVRPDGSEEEAKLQQDLCDLWRQPAIQDEMSELETLLWQPRTPAFDAWLLERHVATLAQGVRSAMTSLVPQVDEEDLALDVIRDDAGIYSIVVSEMAPGGVGQIEAIVSEIHRTPLRFIEALSFLIAECPRQSGATELLRAIAGLAWGAKRSDDFGSAAASVRSALGYSEMEAAKDALRAALRGRGLGFHRRYVVSLMARCLRPGSSGMSDRLMRWLNATWKHYSSKTGISVSPRTFAYCCTQHPISSGLMRQHFQAIGGAAPTEAQLFSQLQQMLVEGCTDTCPECLSRRSGYGNVAEPSRALTSAWLQLRTTVVALNQHPADWRQVVRDHLVQDGKVCVEAPVAQVPDLVEGLYDLVISELVLPSTRESVKIVRVAESAGRVAYTLEVPNFVYV